MARKNIQHFGLRLVRGLRAYLESSEFPHASFANPAPGAAGEDMQMGRAERAVVVLTLPLVQAQSAAGFRVELEGSVSKSYRNIGPRNIPSLVPLTSRVAGLHIVD